MIIFDIILSVQISVNIMYVHYVASYHKGSLFNWFVYKWLVQERSNSIELRLSCTNPPTSSLYCWSIDRFSPIFPFMRFINYVLEGEPRDVIYLFTITTILLFIKPQVVLKLVLLILCFI